MSKADVERKRQESNARNREAADRYQKQANEIQEKHAKNQKQLERLREARSALKKAMTTFAELKKETKQYSTKISNGDFKGTLRDEFDEKAKKMGSSLQKEENGLQENLAKLDTEIAKKEVEQGDLLGAIGSALDSARNFLASIF